MGGQGHSQNLRNGDVTPASTLGLDLATLELLGPLALKEAAQLVLVRFAVGRDDELTPHGDQVKVRFDLWLEEQESNGRYFGASTVAG